MFFLTAGRLFEEAHRHLPKLGQALDALVAAPDVDGAIREHYPTVPSISIDNGIMEKASGLRVIPADFGWDDVGSWAALSSIRPADAGGNVVVGDATLIEGTGNVVVAEAGAPFVSVLGVRRPGRGRDRRRDPGDPQEPCARCSSDRRSRPEIRAGRSALTRRSQRASANHHESEHLS